MGVLIYRLWKSPEVLEGFGPRQGLLPDLALKQGSVPTLSLCVMWL